MRAVIIEDYGANPILADVAAPEPGPGEVKVRVRQSSVNGFDLAVSNGMLKGMMEHHFPVVLGKDFAGTVESVGEGVSQFAAGDEVFGVVTKPALGDGAFGEYVTVPVAIGIARIPDGLDHATASVLGLAGTAALASVDAVAPKAGETVLISGATGGVGAFAVQLAAASGASVIATAQPGTEADFVRKLGAHHTVDYRGDVADAVRAISPHGVDAVIHLAGDARPLAELVVDGGRFASTLGPAPDGLADRPVTATAVMAAPHASVLDRLAADAASGALRVQVQRTYPLDEVPQALADFRRGTLGKFAITLV